MDGDITAIPSSTVKNNVGGSDSDTAIPDSYRDIFDEALPSYLALGMTYDDFYRKDHTLVIAYRQAYEKKREERNTEMWMQGYYVYEAVARVAPLLIPFNQHPKADAYLDKPFPLFEAGESIEEAKSKAVADKGLAYMQAQMNKINKRFGF